MEEEQNQPKEGVLKKLKNKTVPTRLGLLIILLVAVANGAVVLWYMNSYTPPEAFDVSGLVGQMQERREMGNELPDGWSLFSGKVFYRGKLMEAADPEKLEYLGGSYTKDVNNSYFCSSLVSDVDIESFVFLGSSYAKDKNNVFYEGEKIEGSDPETFESLDDYYAKDKNHVFRWGEIINIELNPDSFVVLGYGMIKDDDHVYFENEYDEGVYDLISYVDAATFQYVDTCAFVEKSRAHYTKDKNSVFCGGIKIEGADSETFKVIGMIEPDISGTAIAQDALNVYFGSVLLEGIAGSTMVILSYDYIKDKNHVYLLKDYYGDNNTAQIVKGANPANCTVENLEGCEAPTE